MNRKSSAYQLRAIPASKEPSPSQASPAILEELERSQRTGFGADGRELTLTEFMEEWFKREATPRLRYTTRRGYRDVIDRCIAPHLGGMRISEIAPRHILALYTVLGEGKTAWSIQGRVHAVLSKSLGDAVRWELIPRNPVRAVRAPKPPKKEIKVLSPEQVKQFLATARDDRLYAMYLLAITSGMRQGEILGLQWEDVDFERGFITVRRSLIDAGDVFELGPPKTASSIRKVDLPHAVTEALKEHRKWMRNEGHKTTFVFCNTRGKPYRKGNIQKYSFNRLLKAAGLPRIRFHDLRHTAATLLLSQGVHPKIVQERLGHSQVSITLDIYSHILPTMQQDAVGKLENLVGTAPEE